MSPYYRVLLKKYYPLLITLSFGLIFFNIVFTIIRKYYYGEVPLAQEYIFPVLMGTLFGGGIGLWRIQYIEYKQKVEKIVDDLKVSNDCLKKANEKLSETQNRLYQSQKMELIGTIAGGVAHDLNNVLTASISYPDLILMKLPDNSSIRKPLETIKKSGLKATAMVQDLLTLARRGVPVSEVININYIVHECLASPEFEKIKIHHPGIELSLHLDEELYRIVGSPLHLMKTLINLLSNAAEAMPNGGKLTIETCNTEPERYAVLRVSDSGIGIPEKDIEKIFEPFYTKKTMGRSGTGLGMAVVWGTVKDHKGTIDVKSIEGEGTTFTLCFPTTEKPLTDKLLQSLLMPDAYEGHGESILVVDDMAEQRDITLHMLSMMGYSVKTVSSGEEAVKYIRHDNPDLVIMDMIMAPGIDGLETYKKILEYNPTQKALLVSGFSETARVKEFISLSSGQYIKKPYTLDTLGNAVKDELSKN